MISIGNRPQLSQWTPFTPTGSWNTNVVYYGMYRISGDSMDVRIEVMCTGAPNAANLRVTLPPGVVIDNTKFPNNGSDNYLPIGEVISQQGGAASAAIAFYSGSTTSQQVGAFAEEVTSTPGFINSVNIDATHPYTFGNGDTVTYNLAALPVL